MAFCNPWIGMQGQSVSYSKTCLLKRLWCYRLGCKDVTALLQFSSRYHMCLSYLCKSFPHQSHLTGALLKKHVHYHSIIRLIWFSFVFLIALHWCASIGYGQRHSFWKNDQYFWINYLSFLQLVFAFFSSYSDIWTAFRCTLKSKQHKNQNLTIN